MTVPLIVGYAGSTGSGRWCRKRKTAAYLHRCKFLLRNKHWNYNFFYNLLLNTSGRPLHCEDYDCTTYHDDDKSAVKYRAKGWSAAYCASEQIQCILQHEQTSPSCPTMHGARWKCSHGVRSWLAHAAASVSYFVPCSPPQHQYLLQVWPLEGIKPLLGLSFGNFLSAARLARPILNRKVLPNSCKVNTQHYWT